MFTKTQEFIHIKIQQHETYNYIYLDILATKLSTDKIHYIKDLPNLQQILRYQKFLYNKIFNN